MKDENHAIGAGGPTSRRPSDYPQAMRPVRRGNGITTSVDIPTTGRQALIEVLRGILLGDYGHDLPDAEFYAEADLIIYRLAGKGFEISPSVPVVITAPPVAP